MKKCKNCGHSDDKSLGLNSKGKPYLACCPEPSYKEMTIFEELEEYIGKTIVDKFPKNKALISFLIGEAREKLRKEIESKKQKVKQDMIGIDEEKHHCENNFYLGQHKALDDVLGLL